MANKIVQLTDPNTGDNVYPISVIQDIPQILYGTELPSASLGVNGDIYLLLDGNTLGDLIFAVDA